MVRTALFKSGNELIGDLLRPRGRFYAFFN
jgi:hypothetical protein